METQIKEKKGVTFAHILTVLAIIIIPLVIWGFNMEKQSLQINFNTKEIQRGRLDFREFKKETENSYLKILTKLHNIELILKDKQDKKDK